MISVTVAWDTICQKEQFKYIKEQQQQSMYKVVLIWAAPKKYIKLLYWLAHSHNLLNTVLCNGGKEFEWPQNFNY